MKWKLYWGGLAGCLAGLAFWKNSRRYPNMTFSMRAIKSLADVAITALLARFLSPLLVALCTFWTVQKTRGRFDGKPVWSICVGVVSGIFFSFIADQFLEVLLLLGAGGVVDQITGIRREFLGEEKAA